MESIFQRPKDQHVLPLSLVILSKFFFAVSSSNFDTQDLKEKCTKHCTILHIRSFYPYNQSLMIWDPHDGLAKEHGLYLWPTWLWILPSSSPQKWCHGASWKESHPPRFWSLPTELQVNHPKQKTNPTIQQSTNIWGYKQNWWEIVSYITTVAEKRSALRRRASTSKRKDDTMSRTVLIAASKSSLAWQIKSWHTFGEIWGIWDMNLEGLTWRLTWMGSQVKFLFHLPYFGRSVKKTIVLQPSDLTSRTHRSHRKASFHATLSTFPSNLVVNSLQQVPWHFKLDGMFMKNSMGRTPTPIHIYLSHLFFSKLKTIPTKITSKSMIL